VRTTDLYIAGVGAFLPDRVSTADAVARGWYPADQATSSGILSVCVADRYAAPEMAVLAAREALAMAGPAVTDVRAVLHAYLNFQGARYWDAAPYVALHSLGTTVPGYDVQQSCNGGLAAVELGAQLLANGGGNVLVTAADRFDTVGFDRWNCDSQAVFGDGAGALLLCADRGFARITAVATGADNGLEGESRDATFSRGGDGPQDFTGLRQRYQKNTVPLREHLGRIKDVLTSTLKQVLDDAGRTAGQITRAVPVVPTHPGILGLFQHILEMDDRKSTWDFGATTGHLGAADHLVGLHHLVTTGAVRAGDCVLLVGGGTGFTCTLAVVEMSEECLP
jgi:3-oxoacyl-[acyl-carrier-protein] synthase-3